MNALELNKLSITEREQLLKLARSKLSQKSIAASPIQPVPREGPLPLSYAQQRLWFLTELDDDASSAYHQPLGLRLTGPLDRAALRWALDRLIERHEALRTRFVKIDGEPRQCFDAATGFDLEERALAVGAGDTEIDAIIAAEATRPYDMATGPLIRGVLIRVSEREHVLLINQHHIVSDGWSMGVVVNEVCALYVARCKMQNDPLPPLRIQYADYAVWHRAWFDDARQKQQADYWRRMLTGAPDVVDFPGDRSRPPQQNYAGGSVDCEIDAEFAHGLRTLSQRHGTTLFMTLIAGWAILMARLSGQKDIVIGTPSANRVYVEIEALVGFFVNMLALRFDLSDEPTVAALLAQVKQRSLEAQQNQDMPFEQVVELINPTRSLAYHPLFQSVFAWQNAPKSGDLQLADVQMTTLPAPHVTSRFDLLLSLSDTGETITGKIEYAQSLFEPDTVSRYLDQWRMLLRAMVAGDSARVDRLPMLGSAERERVLETFNATAIEYDRKVLVHELFEHQAERTPDATALMYERQSLSYRELDQRANQLAHHLRAEGVAPDVRVAICAERSIDMVVGLLGILKAGGAYVPLDPGYPHDRLEYMLADSAPALLLTQSHLVDTLPGGNVPVLLLDNADAVSAQPRYRIDPHAIGQTPQHLAYMIYTSGSTGKPKGAMNQHDGVVNRLFWAQQQFALDGSDRVLQKTPFGFDVSVWEFFLPLMAGAGLVMAKPGGHQDPHYLAELIEQRRITVTHFVPSMLQVFVNQADLARCSGLRHVLCSGEALAPALQNRFLERLPAAALHNLYGPTEAAVDVTYWRCVAASNLVPIGRPIANTQMYVLDESMQPVPVGVAGELHIGGIQVGRGYHHRPDLTAERFVDNPFGPLGKLYKTGDLGRWRADGSIEYLGRNDFQVKIRGHRIELGEIEERLRSHPGIREVAVIAREDQPGEKRLVAYAAIDENHEPEASSTLQAAQLDGWEDMYDTTYDAPVDADTLSDFVGWNSSYTGAAMPLDEMHEWRDEAVARIRALKPSRVLEIGCGSGLLLLQLAGGCDRYLGTDLSQRALQNLQRKVAAQGLADTVGLVHRRADDFSGYGNERFDTIILNSVIQYFPSADYLERVIAGAFALLAPGGCIFIGDVRNHRLFEAFHASVQQFRAKATDRVAELAERTRRAMEADGELLVDPALFTAIAERHGGARVQTLLKGGERHNELSKFRYDVVLHTSPLPAPNVRRHRWARDCASPEDLRDLLAASPNTVIIVNDIANARLLDDRRTLALLHDVERAAEERAVEAVCAARYDAPVAAVEPRAVIAAAQSAGWRVELSWLGGDAAGSFHACLYPPSHDAADCDHRVVAASASTEAPRDLANDPLRNIKRARIADALRERLRSELPEHMVPAHFILVDRLPLTPNGKLDRKALPAPGTVRTDAGYVAPRSPAERVLAEIWASTLKIDKVGVHDNFFALGGDSILTIAIVARARDHGIQLRLEQIFKHQTIAGLADHGLLAAVGTDTTVALMSAPALRVDLPEGIEDIYPLSSLQLGMVYHQELAAQSGVYHDVFSFHLSMREWNVEHFRTALDALTRKHPILRTSIELHGDEPTQSVHRDARIPVTMIDLRELDEPARAAAVDAFIEHEKTSSFNLAGAPLARVFIHLRGDNEIQYTLSFHHAILDGWSVAALHAELFRTYLEVRATGQRTLPLAPLASDFKALIAAERQALTSPATRGFWKTHLEDWTPTALPTDLNADGHAGSASAHLDIPAALGSELALLAAMLSVPLRTLMLTAHLRAVALMSGADDVTTGIVSHARPDERDGAEVLGMFLNTLPLRQRLPMGSWRDLINTVFDTELAIAPHRAYPYFQLYLDNGRVGYHDVVFNYVNFHVLEGLEQAGDIRLLGSTGAGSTNFQMAVTVVGGGDTLALGLEYDTGRYSAARARQFLELHIRMLRAMVERPDAPHWNCDGLTLQERETLLHDWGHGPALGIDSRMLHERFEDWAMRTPEAIAVSADGRSLSYAALNAEANCLAHHLRALGVGPDDRVALCLDRGHAMLVAMLAVLKAGGGYVPLDPAYPPERIAFTLGDSAPAVLLTHSAMAGRWNAAGTAVPFAVVEMDAADAWERQNDGNLSAADTGLAAEHLAYVIYTSGSTGQPKGVMVDHRALTMRMQGLCTLYGFDARDRILQFASMSFDGSIEEIFGALSSGATLLLRDDAWLTDAHGFWELCAAQSISIVDLPTRFWGTLVRDSAAVIPDCVRMVIVGGEAMEPAMLDAWFAHTGALPRLLNTYGPTEAVVVATGHEAAYDNRNAACIGRPVPGTRVYVLDPRGQLVPVGARGELYVGGDGLARGYARLPALTSERFVSDPFAGMPTARMYRTGDLVRWLPEGTLEYLGRNDFQVKIRGFRIELGEIEAKLMACAGVREAVVSAADDASGERRLVAYLVMHEGSALAVTDLRDALSQQLAEYMIPSLFMCLDRLPMTPNGKLDRRALPAPDATLMTRAHEAPRGDIEHAVAAIWETLLGIERIGRDDHFFALGGHSLLAIKLVYALKTRLGFTLPLAMLFASPTVAGIAAMIGCGRHARTLLVPLQTTGQGRPLFCLHPVGGQVSFYHALAAQFTGLLPVYGVQSPEVVGLATPLDSVETMARFYAEAIRAEQPEGPYRLIGWSTGGLMALAVARALVERGGSVDYVGLIDTRAGSLSEPGDAQLTLEAAMIELRGGGFALRAASHEGALDAPLSIETLLEMSYAEAAPHLDRWVQPGFGVEAFEHFKTQLPITRHHLKLFSRHRSRPIDAPLQVFWANGSADITDADAERERATTWHQALQTIRIDSDHYGLLVDPYVQRIGSAVAAFLQRQAAPSVRAHHHVAGEAVGASA